jgi:hypothetical protein
MIKSKRCVSTNRESESVDDGVSPAGCKQKRDERIPLVACKKDGHNNKSLSKEESYAIQP